MTKKPSWYGSWPRKSAASTKIACETILGDTLQPQSPMENISRLDAAVRRAASIKNVRAAAAETTESTKTTDVSPPTRAQTLPPIPTLGTDTDPKKKLRSKLSADENLAVSSASSSRTIWPEATGLSDAPKVVVAEETAPTTATATEPTEAGAEVAANSYLTLGMLPAPPTAWIRSWFSYPAAPPTDISTSDPRHPEATDAENNTSTTTITGSGTQQSPETAASAAASAVHLQKPDPLDVHTDAADTGGLPELQLPANSVSNTEADIVSASASASASASVPASAPTSADASAAAGWFSYSYWYGSSVQMPPSDPPKTPEPEPEPTVESASVPEPEDQVMQDAPAATAEAAKPPASGSTWAFWSRQPPATESSSGSAPQPEDGKIAVMGEASEENPKPATKVEPPPPPPPPSPPKLKKKKGSISEAAASKKRHRGASDQGSPPLSASSTDQAKSLDSIRPSKSQPDMALRRQNGSTASLDSVSSDALSTSTKPNLLLPAFAHTYTAPPPPSIATKITNLILRAPPPPSKHVFLKTAPPSRPIRRAISIGVHGLFPAAYLRPMVGQPTGTSLRFATLGAEAIARWTATNGFGGCEIEKVALEGEGKIGERVDNLWKLLLNWLDQLKQADLILVSCHSQGVPVGIMLVAKLLDLGILSPSTHIGVCAMAGVCLGPFPDYKSSMGILMGSAAELWEFSNPESSISRRFEASLRSAVRYGVRITFVGSIDDQLVPMESAVYSPASHPYIYRAVFIDGRLHAPDFIAHLVGFALKLRNLGVSDHGLIRELSVPLAGSLYGGEGHSRLYYDERVYDLALANLLQTTSVARRLECVMGPRERVGASNPYTLPWVMRGLLEEDKVKTQLKEETLLLLRQFDEWKPTTKALKDVKYRLDAVRSRL